MVLGVVSEGSADIGPVPPPKALFTLSMTDGRSAGTTVLLERYEDKICATSALSSGSDIVVCIRLIQGFSLVRPLFSPEAKRHSSWIFGGIWRGIAGTLVRWSAALRINLREVAAGSLAVQRGDLRPSERAGPGRHTSKLRLTRRRKRSDARHHARRPRPCARRCTASQRLVHRPVHGIEPPVFCAPPPPRPEH